MAYGGAGCSGVACARRPHSIAAWLRSGSVFRVRVRVRLRLRLRLRLRARARARVRVRLRLRASVRLLAHLKLALLGDMG